MTITVPTASSPGMVEVIVTDSAQVDQALKDGVAKVMEAATRHHTGVMVTRTGPGRYIVRAHPAVPYGLIRQRHQ
ncbi:hypothetical protein SAMN05660473_03494 [Arthrobacter sp. 49Tsu3.1M3]|nr:hypothetical protein SAMN05660473_03494 [Arthrobacter sp. 49Tsu3.1M3]